jgi:hypothetical protein
LVNIYLRYAQTVDFEKDQLDIKKKMISKLGEGVTLRMTFQVTNTSGQSMLSAESRSI